MEKRAQQVSSSKVIAKYHEKQYTMSSQ